jgi:hypothetical protein
MILLSITIKIVYVTDKLASKKKDVEVSTCGEIIETIGLPKFTGTKPLKQVNYSKTILSETAMGFNVESQQTMQPCTRLSISSLFCRLFAQGVYSHTRRNSYFQ